MSVYSALTAILNSDLDNHLEIITSPRQIFAINALKTSFLKKFQDFAEGEPGVTNSFERHERAVLKFLAANDKCAKWSINDVKQDPEIELVWGETRAILNQVLAQDGFYTLTYHSIAMNLNTGPGKSVGVKDFSFYHKIGYDKMSASSTFIRDYYREIIKSTPLWSLSEEYRESHFGEIMIRDSSSLTTVPKNNQINRTICTEPSLNMMFQKAIGSVLDRALDTHFGIRYKSTSVDLARFYDQSPTLLLGLHQVSSLPGFENRSGNEELMESEMKHFNLGEMLQPDHNRDLARLGSTSNGFCTIDLSSASDTIGRNLCFNLLPKEIFGVLDKFRCKTAKLAEDIEGLDKGEEIQLHMMSSMGNGYTFPLETLIFASLVRAVYRVLRIPFIKPTKLTAGNFGVFGDDIICVTEAAELLMKSLEAFGFEVNTGKTFVQGPFRESCGGDYFEGVDVRGVYMKRLTTLQDKFKIYNLLRAWSETQQIKLPKTFAYLRELLGNKALPVRMVDPIDSGIRENLAQAMDYHLYGSNAVKKIAYKKEGSYRYLYRRYEAVSRHFDPRGSKLKLPPNEPALVLAWLRGELRDGLIITRFQRAVVRYKLCIAVYPSWTNYDVLTTYLLDKYGLL